MTTATEKKIAKALAATLKVLPQRAKCPKCKKAKSVATGFGLRVMSRDSKGIPTRVARQSYCKTCRA